MEIRRKFTALTLIAMMVAMGVVASTHTHVHPTSDGVANVHLGHCSHAHGGCGHSPVETDQDSKSVPDSDDHEDCQVCKFLAEFNSTAVASVQFNFATLNTSTYAALDASIVSLFSRRASVRGPPA